MERTFATKLDLLQVGDRVLEVNGTSVGGKEPHEIVRLLAGTNGTVTFKLLPAEDKSMMEIEQSGGSDNRRQYVRALFEYRPIEDQLHPCPEAALSFRKGDILELLDTTDQHWWQVGAGCHISLCVFD